MKDVTINSKDIASNMIQNNRLLSYFIKFTTDFKLIVTSAPPYSWIQEWINKV